MREKFKFYFYFQFSLSDLRKTDCRISSGQTRKVLYATRATHGNKKHRISLRIQVKIWKNPSFEFFSDLRRSNGRNFSNQESKLLYATRATREYQNYGISSDFHVK